MSEEFKKSRIYTKKGDQGKTFLVSGSCVEKFNVRVEAYGTIDELNSQLGLLRFHLTSLPKTSNLRFPEGPKQQDILLEKIQNHLFCIGSLLACEDLQIQKNLPQLTDSQIQFLEMEIDKYDSPLPELKQFILPSGGLFSNYYHVARTFCRRSERRTAEIFSSAPHAELIHKSLIYLNRLSDLFFVLARWNNWNQNIEDALWDKKK